MANKELKCGDTVKLIDRKNCPRMIITYMMAIKTSMGEVTHIECMWFEDHMPLQRGVFEASQLTHFNTPLEGVTSN